MGSSIRWSLAVTSGRPEAWMSANGIAENPFAVTPTETILNINEALSAKGTPIQRDSSGWANTRPTIPNGIINIAIIILDRL